MTQQQQQLQYPQQQQPLGSLNEFWQPPARTGAGLRNSDGVEVHLGGQRGTGGDTGLPPSQVYYCGRRMNQCRCGSCDGQCGPRNGCPCNSCRAFLMTQQQQQLRHLQQQQQPQPQKQDLEPQSVVCPARLSAQPLHGDSIASSASSSSETLDCIICFERIKNATFIHGRTGHTCCCIECAEDILRRRLPCPICREPISTVIENFTV